MQAKENHQWKKTIFMNLMHGICISLETSVNTLFWCWMKMYETDRANTCGKYTCKHTNAHMDRDGMVDPLATSYRWFFSNLIAFILFVVYRRYSLNTSIDAMMRSALLYSAHTFLFLPLQLSQVTSLSCIFARIVFIYTLMLWHSDLLICHLFFSLVLHLRKSLCNEIGSINKNVSKLGSMRFLTK